MLDITQYLKVFGRIYKVYINEYITEKYALKITEWPTSIDIEMDRNHHCIREIRNLLFKMNASKIEITSYSTNSSVFDRVRLDYNEPISFSVYAPNDLTKINVAMYSKEKDMSERADEIIVDKHVTIYNADGEVHICYNDKHYSGIDKEIKEAINDRKHIGEIYDAMISWPIIRDNQWTAHVLCRCKEMQHELLKNNTVSDLFIKGSDFMLKLMEFKKKIDGQ